MKRILNKLFSKLVLGGLIIILQFSWFVYLLYSATVYSSMVDALFKIASIVLALFVSSRDMRSTYKTSWIFLILALPLFGIPAYYLFGRPGLTKRTRMKMDVVSSRIRAYSSPSDDVMSALRAEDDSAGQQAQYLTRYAGYPVYREAFRFSPNPCIAVHNTGTGDLIISKFHPDLIHSCIQLSVAFFIFCIFKQRHLFISAICKACQCHTNQT